MVDQKIADALNEQIGHEFYSQHLYLAMAAYFDLMELKGFGHWMRIQAAEEAGHAMKVFEFLLDLDAEVRLNGVKPVPAKWKDTVHVFEDALAHEQKVTEFINGIYELALKESHAAAVFLQWFVTEQVEEEATARELLHKAMIAQESKAGLLFLDSELAKRK
ncbi:MAG: ferritin [Candidatus Diapherotrites archaeon]|nr:ferritin [Candidatus Diapherotrites archaeon]